MDILKQLLLEQRGPDTEAVRAYFQSQSLEQACATCLILATLESSQNAEVPYECFIIIFYPVSSTYLTMNVMEPTLNQSKNSFSPIFINEHIR